MPGRGSETNPDDWFIFAGEDFKVARRSLDDGTFNWAWIALEQAAEKLLKGMLISQSANFHSSMAMGK